MAFFGGIEAGGTKFVCMVSTSPDHIVAETKFPTTSPEETIARTNTFFMPFIERGELAAVGFGSFGPLDLNPASETYGFITKTPKPGWSYANLFGGVQDVLKVPVAIDTDVNAAAFGEYFWVKENENLDPLLYITIGTGIGVGAVVNGHPVHGLVHTEGGHIVIPHDKTEDPFEGICPYHKDCWEGLASGPAMAKRWGMPAENLADDHPGWDLEAKYIALAIVNQIYLYSPQRIVLGGGVSQHPGLLKIIRGKVQQILNGYVQADMILNHMDQYVVSPGLGKRSGVLGAIALAKTLLFK
jgi:fructokinase